MSRLLLFVAPLLSYQPPRIALFALYPQYLLVPLAAFLGARFGGLGVLAIAIGGLPFVITIYSPVGLIGGSPAVYVVSLAVAAIAASPRSFLECFSFPKDDRAAWWLALVSPFLIVFFVGATFVMEPALQISWNFGFSVIAYMLLFALGVRGVPGAPVALGIVLAFAASWALAYALVTVPRDSPELRVAALQPSMALAALAMFSAGRATAAHLKGEAPSGFWRRPWVAVVLVVLLWFGPPQIAGIPLGLPFAPRLYFLQVAAALPLAGFMAGLFAGTRGALAVTGLVVALLAGLLLVGMAVGRIYNPHLAIGTIELDAPFVAAAFALLGARVARARAER